MQYILKEDLLFTAKELVLLKLSMPADYIHHFLLNFHIRILVHLRGMHTTRSWTGISLCILLKNYFILIFLP